MQALACVIPRYGSLKAALRKFAELQLVVWIVSLLLVPSAAAQAPTPDTQPAADDVNRVASRLYCPVCESEPLDVCQTPACVQWKAQIAQFLAEGRSDDEIVQIFAQRYGLRVLGEPPAVGVTLILWIGPVLVAIAGGFYALRVIRRMSRRGEAAPGAPAPPATPTGDEYLDRVERELKQQL